MHGKWCKFCRAKLYHIRDKAAKEIRRQMRNIREVKETEGEESAGAEKADVVEVNVE
jgi:hypothetical protein